MTGPPLRYHSSTVFISKISGRARVRERAIVGRGSAQNVATSPIRRRRRSAYRLSGAGGVPDRGRGADGGRAVESVVDREVVSDRVTDFGETISSGGRIEGQKSWSKKPGT